MVLDFYFYFFLLCLIFKLSFIIGMCIQEKPQYEQGLVLSSFRHPLWRSQNVSPVERGAMVMCPPCSPLSLFCGFQDFCLYFQIEGVCATEYFSLYLFCMGFAYLLGSTKRGFHLNLGYFDHQFLQKFRAHFLFFQSS